jgi:hypothetical protein
MRVKSVLKTGLAVVLAAAIIILIIPAAANATIYDYCTFGGIVKLNGSNVPLDSKVNAWITGVATVWQVTVAKNGNDTSYYLIIPENTGGTSNKNGGDDNDIVHFSVTVNGLTIMDATTGVFLRKSDKLHDIIIVSNITPLTITTATLASTLINQPYSCTVEATGGTGNYTWSASGLPSGLAISTSNNKGIISGTPTVSGNFNVAVTVKDSSIPVNTSSRTFILAVQVPIVPFSIITTELPRWPVEVYPANPPAIWGTLPKPGWIINQPYTATMEVSNKPYGNPVWSATNLPPGLSISSQGIISGNATTAGVYNIVFKVEDSANAQNFHNITLTLQIYIAGDADGNGSRAVNDVTFLNRVILGLEAPRAGCDANISQSITIADVTKLERLLAGITK